MAYPLDNFGDYNVIRNDLKEADGSVEILYKNIEAAAVAKARPRIFKNGCLAGIGIGMGICSIIYGGYNYYKYKKREKKALKTEPKLKDELIRTLKESGKAEIEEQPSSKSDK